jgi:cytochrome c biogenesis protein CcdA/thiol-disulfide isomerase/thioredoxin
MSIINSQSALALAEGFGLAFSPCILPILPFILAASAVGNKLRPFLIIGGFIISFTAFALISRQILALTGIQQDTIQYGAYVLLLLFGLTMIVPYFEERFASLTNKLASGAENFSSGKRAEGTVGALLVGALIGVVWTPCAGPILASALLQVLQAQTSFDAVITMTAFSIGASVPMLAIALFGQQLSHRIRSFAKHASLIRRVMGTIIIIFALCGLFGFNIGQWVGTALPSDSSSAPVEQTDTPQPAATATDAPVPNAPLPDAPEIGGITQWFNSGPLTPAQLKGKVVLVDFWTYSCINCIRTLPHIEGWYEKYKDQGLVVIGVHSPEFPFEGKPDNVAAAVKKFGITYPVAMDNDYVTWKNYKNEYWPAHYLINRDGKVVETHFGEGHYVETENAIRKLLGLDQTAATTPDVSATTKDQTPETYVGYHRAARLASPQPVTRDHSQTFSIPADLQMHQWALSGQWTVASDRITAGYAGASLRLHFKAGKVFLVMGNQSGHAVTATLKLNGKPIGDNAGKDAPGGVVTIDQQRLYELVSQPSVSEGVLDITANAPGLDAYAFTFGN